MRFEDRKNNQLRPVKITKNFLNKVSTSVLIEFGNTKVLCGASFESKQPPFLINTSKGWVTAEYSMLPLSTDQRVGRERGKVGGRTQEIQRLIGRSLRAITDLEKLNKYSITVDCDVLQADGGTRTASITGAYISLSILFNEMLEKGLLTENPLRDSVAAISVGIIDGHAYLDLDYSEDSKAEVDMNFVLTGDGGIIEVQGTAETKPFNKEMLDQMYNLAFEACNQLKDIQKYSIG
ncbi:MAG: ribonuclease PH [Candidatus Sericytochromatia bacterium]|nr:ribonuclease PH [Candidatus Sericytochromatia bacterium]